MTLALPMDGGVAPIRKRRRHAPSCIQCRQRKVKCDRNTPCGQCIQSRHSATCLYSPGDAPATAVRRVEVANSSATSSNTIGLGSVESTINSPTLRFSASSATQLPYSSAPRTLLELGFQNSHPRSGIEDSEERTHKSEQLSDAVSKLQDDSANVISFSETSPRMRGILSKTRFFGQSHWMAILEEVRSPKVSKQFESFG